MGLWAWVRILLGGSPFVLVAVNLLLVGLGNEFRRYYTRTSAAYVKLYDEDGRRERGIADRWARVSLYNLAAIPGLIPAMVLSVASRAAGASAFDLARVGVGLFPYLAFSWLLIGRFRDDEFASPYRPLAVGERRLLRWALGSLLLVPIVGIIELNVSPVS